MAGNASHAKSRGTTQDMSISALGSRADDGWLGAQFNWENFEHLIKTGRILGLTYDFEATGLNTIFDHPTQFCGKVTTLDGKIIDSIKMNIQVPRDVVVSPQAAIVTQSHPQALHETGTPAHEAAARIMLFFRNPYRKLWDALVDQAEWIKSGSEAEEVRLYTLSSGDGRQHAQFRIHQGGKFLSFRQPLEDGKNHYFDADGTRWTKIAAPALTEGHNIRRYDDRLLWSFLHRYLSNEIFITHTKKFQRFRIDTLDLAKLVALLETDGRNGLKPGRKINPQTGQEEISFTLGSLMEANTRTANAELGTDEGVRMPDGSRYDRARAHVDAGYDVNATIALKAYLRRRMPELVRQVEINAEFERIKPFLIGGEGFEMHPLRAFARNIYPQQANLHFGVCVGINEEVEERREALMIRTDLDQKLEDYTYLVQGQRLHLTQMSVAQLAAMMKAQRGDPQALFEVLQLRKNPPVVEAQMAFARGIGGKPEWHEENRRFLLAHPQLQARLMAAHTLAMPPIHDWRHLRNPQAQEHVFTNLAALKRYEIEMEDGSRQLLHESVHKEWIALMRRHRAIDDLLRRAVKPQTIEIEVRPDTLETFIDRMQTVDQALAHYHHRDHDADDRAREPSAQTGDNAGDTPAPIGRFRMLPAPRQTFIPPRWDYVPDPARPGKTQRIKHVMDEAECAQLTAHAVEYLWQLRAELLQEFHDNSTQFTVVDARGHEVAFSSLNRMDAADRARRLSSGEYQIVPEALDFSRELLARMFRDAGRIGWVKQYWVERGCQDEVAQWEAWEQHFTAQDALRAHGAPHLDVSQQRWFTAVMGLKEIARIRQNLQRGDVRATGDAWGLWDIFLRNRDQAEHILGECAQYYETMLQQNPLTPQQLHQLGYDPQQSGYPIEHTKYHIPPGAKQLVIDAPDAMLEQPLVHADVAHTLMLLALTPEQRVALKAPGSETYLILRAAETGRQYLAAKATLLRADEIAPGHYFAQQYEDAVNRYLDSAMPAPDPQKLVPLAVEALVPLPGQISDAPAIKLMWDTCVGVVSPKLAHYDQALTGLAVQDLGFTPQPGPVRLQAMVEEAHKPGLSESGWEVAAQIAAVRSLSLAQLREAMETGRKQMRVASALGLDSREALLAALAQGSVSAAQARHVGFKTRESLRDLMAQPAITHDDAVHYGFAGLSDMKSKITHWFADQELHAGDPENRLHLVDLVPGSAGPMQYNYTGRRPLLAIEPAPQNATSLARPESPDPTAVHGAPEIVRARPAPASHGRGKG